MISGGEAVAAHVCIVLEHHMSMTMGGAEYQAHQLAEELCRRRGVRVTYLARESPAVSSVSYDIRAVGRRSLLSQRSLAPDVPNLLAALRAARPDVIYQRAKHAYTAVCAYYAGHAGIPMVFHVANEPDADGRWFRKSLSANSPLDLLDVALGNWGVRRASRIVVQTTSQAKLLDRAFQREAAALVPNFQPLPSRLPTKHARGFRVLWVGNIKETKRPKEFIELAERMSGIPEVEFWMVGRAAAHRGMRATMTAIRDSRHIRYFGELPLDEVNSLMSEADVFVNTSRFEGFPNTFIQAWARGAIVASLDVDIDGGMEALGIGYCTHDMERLAALIGRLQQAPQVRRDVADRAFAYVHERHSLENAAMLADFVLDVAKHGRSRAVDGSSAL